MFRFLSNAFNYSNRSSEKAKKPIFFQNVNQDSFTVQYLMNKCGFSREKAVIASIKYVKFDKPDQPDSVICFLKNQGFTESQIRKGIASCPRILSANSENTLLPKIEFLRSKGATKQDLAGIFVFRPSIFRRSLEGYILPSFNFIREFLGSDKDAILAISSRFEIETHVKPNIKILLEAGMCRSDIGYFIKKRPLLFSYSPDALKESVKLVQKLGMNPRNHSYGLALAIVTTTRRSTWNKRMEAYKKWGCSEDDVLRTFKILPSVMNISEEKINAIMSLFVHEIGWQSSKVVKRYFMFTLSLNKRMIPRWSVYRELIAKGLVKKEAVKCTMFTMKEDLFLKKFVNCCKNEAPVLLKLYIEKQAIK
ncbi:hypothetical protein Leryth_006362 [Lithospermum erythrorhizon]|nr:hypothetical protein Leryth_006362 [Lithospermum erythrorhizon]